jgi:hypothetical protein
VCGMLICWYVICDMWYVGMWKVICGMLVCEYVVCKMWYVDIWYVECGKWYVIC